MHTPDGAPCGLLNHLTANCVVTDEPHTPKARLASLLGSLGMSPVEQSMVFPPSYLTVLVDGQVFGKIPRELAPSLVNRLRLLKTAGTEEVCASFNESVDFNLSCRRYQKWWRLLCYPQRKMGCSQVYTFSPHLLVWCDLLPHYPMEKLSILVAWNRYYFEFGRLFTILTSY